MEEWTNASTSSAGLPWGQPGDLLDCTKPSHEPNPDKRPLLCLPEQEGQGTTTSVKDFASDRASNVAELPELHRSSLPSTLTPTDYQMKHLVHTMTQPRLFLPTFTSTDRKEYGMFLREFHQYLTDNAVAGSVKLRLLNQA